jgi:hypothetical protein
VVAQTRSRLAGVMPDSSSRLVSLHDADARPIRKGRLGKPVEFGYQAQIVDNADGVILDHSVEVGNARDTAQLAPAIERIIRRTGRRPRAVVSHHAIRLLSQIRVISSPRLATCLCRLRRLISPRPSTWRGTEAICHRDGTHGICCMKAKALKRNVIP